MARLKIGALAERTGTNAPTIRYYEEIGLLRSADRQAGGQRIYGGDDVKRLTFIRRCREFGFSIDQVRSLVALVQDPQSSCMHARDLAEEHLRAVCTKITELKILEPELRRIRRKLRCFLCRRTKSGLRDSGGPLASSIRSVPFEEKSR